MSLLENYIDIGRKLNLRYAITPISGISGSPAPTNTTVGSNVVGYIYDSTSGGTITIGTAGSYCAILVQRGFNGTNASTTSSLAKDNSITYSFNGGNGGGTGQMILAYGWIPAGTYNYSIGSTTSFNGLVASNTSPSTTITSGFGSTISYDSIYGAFYSSTNSITGTAPSNPGFSSQILNFPTPLNGIVVIGGSGASGAVAPSSTTTLGGGAGRSGLGGLANGGSIGAGQNATVYGAGGGGAPMYQIGSTTAATGTPGIGGPGCVIIVPFELLNAKNVTNPTTYIDINYFNMGGYSLTNLLDERLVPCLDSNAFITYNVPNPSLVSFGTLYPFGSANTITYLSGLGFKTMPFALTGSNSIKYVISRNTSTNLYYMTLFAENTCTLTTNTTLSSVSFICCGNGGTAGGCSGASPSFGAGGGGIGTGLLGYAIGSGTVISITRANGSNTVLVIGPFTEATATAGGNSTTSAAGATGTATTAGYTSYNGGAGGSGSGVNGSNAGSTSITINSGYNLTSTGFGGGGRAGNGTTSNGGGGSYGFGGTGTSRAGLGYGAGAGGQIGNATPASQAGNPGVVILSFLI